MELIDPLAGDLEKRRIREEAFTRKFSFENIFDRIANGDGEPFESAFMFYTDVSYRLSHSWIEFILYPYTVLEYPLHCKHCQLLYKYTVYHWIIHVLNGMYDDMFIYIIYIYNYYIYKSFYVI